MTTRASGIKRTYEVNEDPVLNDVPAVATDIVYEGSAVGDNASGYGRPLVAADPFMGFACADVDNSAGAAGDKKIRVRQKGTVQLTVVGATGPGDVGETVYASDDDTFTLTAGSNTAIGKVARHVSGTTCMVRFEALQARSL
jgi:hypothetical protein